MKISVRLFFAGVVFFATLWLIYIRQYWDLSLFKFPGYFTPDFSGNKIRALYYDVGWNVDKNLCKGVAKLKGFVNFQKELLKSHFSSNSVVIYTFNLNNDQISRRVHLSNNFEYLTFQIIQRYITMETNIDFIDIGTNIGVFALQVANLGRRVIAIDASRDCLMRLCASVEENGFQEKITLVNNAVLGQSGSAMLIKTKNGNYGFNYIETNETRLSIKRQGNPIVYSENKEPVWSLKLDSLIFLNNEHIVSNRVFLKIDTEGTEHKILQGAHLFFKFYNVKGVLLEWDKHFDLPTGDVIINFMEKHNLKPHDCKNIESHKDGSSQLHCFEIPREKLRLNRLNVLWLPK